MDKVMKAGIDEINNYRNGIGIKHDLDSDAYKSLESWFKNIQHAIESVVFDNFKDDFHIHFDPCVDPPKRVNRQIKRFILVQCVLKSVRKPRTGQRYHDGKYIGLYLYFHKDSKVTFEIRMDDPDSNMGLDHPTRVRLREAPCTKVWDVLPTSDGDLCADIKEYKTNIKIVLENCIPLFKQEIIAEESERELLGKNSDEGTLMPQDEEQDEKNDGESQSIEDSEPTKNIEDVCDIPNRETVPTVDGLSNKKNMPLNQILYGPPGTGKTYHTINKALEIIGFDIANKDRATIKNAFDEYVKKEQIIFTTFHQSMNYEDFIEGIKPVEPKNEGENLSYKIEPGILKKLAIEASFAVAKVKNLENTTESHDFSSQYDQYIADIDEKLMVGKRPLVKSRNDAYISIDSISSNRNIIIRHVDSPRTYIVSKERLMKLHKAFPQLETIQNINTAFQEVIGGANMSAYWAILNDIRQNGSKKVDKKSVFTWGEKSQVVSEMQKKDYICSNSEAQPPNFVLIIDEINRGNVSQIFGELITLIEESKRLGKDEALEIMLPYSKQMFGVPSNLYIIGTMNTADRSVEALDTALRRRFVFEEMMPNPKLLGKIEGFELSNLLTIINERIEVLLNRDNSIGHSYFLNVASLDELKSVFFNNIIPLLQEYFYGDYGKIGLVLGEGFVKLKSSNAKFAKFSYDNDLPEKKVYEIIPNTNDFNIENALKRLLNE